MKKAILAGVLALASTLVLAQGNVRVRGTITALEGDVLRVKSREGRDIELRLPAGSRADLKPGESIFAVARQEAGGKLVAPRVTVSRNGVRPPQ